MSTAPPSPQASSHSPVGPSHPNLNAESHAADVDVNTRVGNTQEHASPSAHEVDITEVRGEGVAGERDGQGDGVAPPALKGDLDDEKDEERERTTQRESSIWPNDLPPSPPLTPSQSNTGRSAADPLHIVDKGGESEDEDEDEHEPAFSTTVGGHEHETETADSHDPPPVKARTTVVRQASAIQLDAKMEPQPWDLVDPPETNGQSNAEYYATLKGHKFNTLNSSCVFIVLFGPPPSDSAYGTQPIGQIGVHHPREILRVERDYSGGELIQFAPIYPLELEGRITPTQFLESINAINEVLISAHSLRHSFLDNMLSVFTLQLSRLILTSHYEKQMRQLQLLIQELNERVYNPVGLNILWPRKVAFLFMEIEYY
ncbi:Golgin subfamily A member 7/ERF4 family-domain-containing protein, partial [Mycena olivaceomarginata]